MCMHEEDRKIESTCVKNICSKKSSKTSPVHAGLAAHENPIQPMASPSISPRIDGNELPAGKYA